MNYPTPHIDAVPDDFAKTVIMPGDPLRSKFIAENFLSNPILVNNVRSVQGYTGEYKGKRISVMASGMGMPSMAIYSHELFNFFGVENIIRVGSAGGMNKNVKLRDIIIAQGACTDSAYADNFSKRGTIAPIAEYSLLEAVVNKARELKFDFKVGNVLTTDAFYKDEDENDKNKNNADFAKMGVLAVEMETAALYLNAMRAGKRAVSVLTVSDHLLTGESTDSNERQTSFTDMIKLALETAVSLD